jgi:hypothetical protein
MSGSNEKDLSELERTLAGLAPSPAGFDRDRLMFQAGQSAAAPRRRWLWPSATAVMTTVAACLGGVLLVRPAPEQVVRYVHVERDPQPPVISPDKPVQPEKPAPPAPVVEPPTAPSTLASHSYWRLQEIVVRHGVDALPDATTPGAPGPPPSPGLSAWDWRSRAPGTAPLFNAGEP